LILKHFKVMKKNYLKEFGSRPIMKFQVGGGMPMDPAGAAPAPEQQAQQAPQGPAPEEGAPNIDQMMMQVLESQDPQMALQLVNILAEASGMGAGGGQQMPMGRYGMKIPTFSKSILQ
jgi:hypothetical protein